MSIAAPLQLNLLCAGKEYGQRLIALTLVREIGRIPFVRAVLTLERGIEDSFAPGDAVEVKAGEKGKATSIFKGLLTSAGFSLRGGERLLRLEIRDAAHSLTLGLQTRLYLNKSDSDICKEILSAHGLAADIPQTPGKHAQLQQVQANDWDFLLSRLWANGLVPIVRNGKVSACAADASGSRNTVKVSGASESVLELETRWDSRSWLDSVTVTNWDEAAQKAVAQKSSGVKPEFPGTAKPKGKTTQDVLIPHAVEPDESKNLGKGLLWRAGLGFLCGRVRLLGYYKAMPGDMLHIQDIAGFADGSALIWATRLELRAGLCSLDIQFGYDFLERLHQQGSKPGLTHPLQGGQPHIQGLYSGKVLKISGDPEQGERIQVHIPLLHEAGKGVWARMAALYAGKGYGVVFRPEKDDEVLLGFLGGDPRAPVIVGALPSKANPAPDTLAAKDEKNTCKGLTSKNGLTLLLNEEDKSLTLETPGKQSVCLNDKDGLVSLTDKNGNSLSMDKSGITLKSNKDIVLQAQGNITLKAAQNLQGEGLQVTMEGKQAIALSGNATAELKAGGMLTVKGGLVKIN
ncbi:phage baseplate assembly protein V [Desulfovibrio cuneatus]|uniref:phage baseplate assembly protein V n=1 Tax=Desulfovibrio cuneatus TaxID=159728 RepID=UPI0004099BFE|nr:phage baseplate assembly protein V [Desulfovibrio cuneatus]